MSGSAGHPVAPSDRRAQAVPGRGAHLGDGDVRLAERHGPAGRGEQRRGEGEEDDGEGRLPSSAAPHPAPWRSASWAARSATAATLRTPASVAGNGTVR